MVGCLKKKKIDIKIMEKVISVILANFNKKEKMIRRILQLKKIHNDDRYLSYYNNYYIYDKKSTNLKSKFVDFLSHSIDTIKSKLFHKDLISFKSLESFINQKIIKKKSEELNITIMQEVISVIFDNYGDNSSINVEINKLYKKSDWNFLYNQYYGMIYNHNHEILTDSEWITLTSDDIISQLFNQKYIIIESNLKSFIEEKIKEKKSKTKKPTYKPT